LGYDARGTHETAANVQPDRFLRGAATGDPIADKP